MAADFFTAEVWTRQGLRRSVVLFVMELATRKVEVAGIGPAPNELWMKQIARNLTAGEDGIVNGKRYLIHDRDPLFNQPISRSCPTSPAILGCISRIQRVRT